MGWEEDDDLRIDQTDEESYTCNTKKDKDKRVCRHTFGVLFGCSPCGVGKIKISFGSYLVLIIKVLFHHIGLALKLKG